MKTHAMTPGAGAAASTTTPYAYECYDCPQRGSGGLYGDDGRIVCPACGSSNVVRDAFTYRAAYWSDGQGSVILTPEDMAEATDEYLIAEALAEMEKTGLTMGDGEILVGYYTV